MKPGRVVGITVIVGVGLTTETVSPTARLKLVELKILDLPIAKPPVDLVAPQPNSLIVLL